MDAFDVSVFKILAEDQLIKHIESVHGNKDLIIDKQLMKPLERIVGVSSLREHGIEKIYKLEDSVVSSSSILVYIIQPSSKNIKTIIKQHEDDLNVNFKRSRILILFGGKNIVIDHLIEASGLYNVIVVEEFTYDFIALDNDILSMESFDFYEDLYIKHTNQPLYNMARSLATLLSLVGYIEDVTCIGSNSLSIYSILQSVIKSNDTDHIIKQVEPEFSRMFIFDRAMDPISFLLSEFSYNGLLGEVFGIKSGFIEIDKEIIGQDKSIKCLLTSSDKVFEEIRDFPVSAVFPILKSKAQSLQKISDKAGGLATVGQIREYVSNDLKKLQDERHSLMIHLCCGETIMKVKNMDKFDKRRQVEFGILAGSDEKFIVDYITDTILNNSSASSILRLLCLWNVLSKNIINKQYYLLAKVFIQTFGLEHIMTFHKLHEANLYSTSKLTLNINWIDQLELIPKIYSDNWTLTSNDLSYPNGGCYRPLISVIIDKILLELNTKWISEKSQSNYSQLNQIFGPSNFFHCKMTDTSKSNKACKSILIVTIGGITFSEIGSLRIIAKKYGLNITICTSSIQTGEDIFTRICQTKPMFKLSSPYQEHQSNIKPINNNENCSKLSSPSNTSMANNLNLFRNKSSTKLNEAQTFINDNFKKLFK